MGERIILSKEMLARAVGDRWSETELDEAISLLTRAEGRFPSGIRSLSPDLVRAVQRTRLLAAMTRKVNEVGYSALTVQDVLDPAGISRPTFYEQFSDKEDCFLAAFDIAATDLRQRTAEAVASDVGDWRERLREGVSALLGFIAEEPESARLVIVQARAASSACLRRRDALLDEFSNCIDAIVRESFDGPVPPLAAPGVVGGIEAVLYSRLQKDELGDDPEALQRSLMYFAVLAYGGRKAAKEELDATPSS